MSLHISQGAGRSTKIWHIGGSSERQSFWQF